MSCIICTDKLNNSRNSEVKCEHCQFSACRTCCQTYIIDQTKAKCMNNDCIPEWSRKFMVKSFTKTFVNQDWKKVRENVLFDGEKALLPATQGVVEQRKNRIKMQADVKELDKQIFELNRRRTDLVMNYDTTRRFGQERRNFIRGCPQGDCRGFLSSMWKCGTCATWTCPDCHEVKGEFQDSPHTCDPNNVETAKLLAKDTKPCPKCATGIYKIEGCDQMWCTQCHTAFSWRTGQIETHIHNPHFYEWQRKNGGAPRVAGDVECGQELNHTTFDHFRNAILRGKHKRFLNYCDPSSIDGYDWTARHHSLKVNANGLSDIIRRTIHNVRIELPQFRTDHLEKNQELRVQYLCNEIDEDTFKILVQRNDKKHRKNSIREGKIKD